TATEWNAGGYPTQWIEIDFGSPHVITGISALIDQLPNGVTIHKVTLDGVSVFSWTGYTAGGQTLSHSFGIPQTVQVVRITTTAGQCWVAWVEIKCEGSPGN